MADATESVTDWKPGDDVSDYKPHINEVVAVRGEVCEIAHVGGLPSGVRLYDDRGITTWFHVAPWLSADDQAALMRMARAAVEWDNEEPDSMAEDRAAHSLSLAIACLPASLRDRVMTGGEG